MSVDRDAGRAGKVSTALKVLAQEGLDIQDVLGAALGAVVEVGVVLKGHADQIRDRVLSHLCGLRYRTGEFLMLRPQGRGVRFHVVANMKKGSRLVGYY